MPPNIVPTRLPGNVPADWLHLPNTAGGTVLNLSQVIRIEGLASTTAKVITAENCFDGQRSWNVCIAVSGTDLNVLRKALLPDS